MIYLRPAHARWGAILAPVLIGAVLTACDSTLEQLVPTSQQSGGPVLLAAAGAAEEADGYQVARSPYGNYLAGRHADRQRDLSIATDYMLRALELDPDNLQLLARAFALAAGDGRHAEAVDLAERLVAQRPKHGTARLVLAVEAADRGDFAEAEVQLAEMPDDGMGQIVSGMAGSWIAMGIGNVDQAMERVAKLESLNGFAAYYNLHRALLSDVAGRSAEAETYYDKARESAGRPWLRLAVLTGNAYERFGKKDKAEEVYREIIALSPETTFFDPILRRLEEGVVPAPVVADVRAGLAESFFNVASLLGQERSEDMALIYAHLALRLRPDFDGVQVLIAEILQQQGRAAEAIAAYEKVPKDSAFFWSVQLRIAEELGREGQIDAAIARLEALAESQPDRFEPLFQMGNLFRSEERFEEAVEAFDRAMERIGEPEARHWSILYFRGISLERTGEWSRAEADFLRALEFEPEQPYVMNYLAYSWVEQEQNLDKAKEMLAKAVELRPDDGYIVDSLGWVFYRFGDYQEAVKYLERAVELRPSDPVINDHLGDAYWRVGRQSEARFQWRRALSFEPEADLIPEIQSKLEEGLTAADRKNI